MIPVVHLIHRRFPRAGGRSLAVLSLVSLSMLLLGIGLLLLR